MRNISWKHLKINTLFFVLLCAPSLIAQNLITNGEFETSGGYSSEYERIYGANGVGAGQYAIDNTTANHGGGAGWPQPANSSGRFMIVNGFGTNVNPTKTVWTTQQPIPVTLNTTYTFSCRVANLNVAIQGQIMPAKLRLKINGQEVGGQNQLPSDNNWHEWSVVWNSQNATQAVIQIVDEFTGNSSLGDDYALDGMSFVASVTYNVVAHDDPGITVCQNEMEIINVLGNDVITPNANDATVSVVTEPTHGNYIIRADNTIQYVSNVGDFTSDQFKYRVTTHGVSSEAWVYITLNTPPAVGNIATPAEICAGGSLGISAPMVTPAVAGVWQYQTTSGAWQTFDPTNIPITMNGCPIRYWASNGCGENYSNSVVLTVTNGPNFTAQTPQLMPICEGDNLNLTPPTYSGTGTPVGWVISPTEQGDYQSFNTNNISSNYNGYYIRYKVHGNCGDILSSPARQLIVNAEPDITGTLAVPEAICTGGSLNLSAPVFDGTGTGVWEIGQNPNANFQTFDPQNVSSDFDGWYVHYKVSNECDSDVSNAVLIHVNEAPTIATPATPQAVCANGSLNLTVPSIQTNGTNITAQGWQIGTSQNGSFAAFSNGNLTYADNGKWIRYYAENECGENYSTAVQITVNDIPEVSSITAPAAICAGEAFALNAPQVNWRHTVSGSGSWEIAPTSSGEFVPLTNSNIPYEYNGYYLRYKAVNGCDTAYSTNVVPVTVYSTEPTYETITACDTYVWNGVTCDHTDEYQATIQSPNGCDITAHLQFHLSNAYTETINASSCGAYHWDKNGQTYTVSDTYEYAVESGNPLVCDSIFTLVLTVNNAPVISGNISAPSSVCAGSPLVVNAPQYAINHENGGDAHWEFATSANGPFTTFDPASSNLGLGTYYLRYAVANACDDTYSNVVSFHVDDAPVANMQLASMQICEGQSLDLPAINVAWNDTDESSHVAQWQMASSQSGNFAMIDPTMPMQLDYDGYWIRFLAHNSCGEDIVGPVKITVVPETEEWLETLTECDSYTLPSGEVITTSQVVDYESYEPCFHVVHQPIVINHSDHTTEQITSCREEYVWHGMTFHHSDQTQYATVTLSNGMNCDSVVDLQLDFGDYASFTHNRTACGSFVWEMKPGYTYTESVRDSVFVEATDESECDTWYYLNLTLGQEEIVDGGTMTECSGFVWYGVPYYDNAVVFDSLQTVVTHCDSVIAYELVILQPIETDTNVVACHPMWWHGQYCEEEGAYQHTFQSEQGCDSIVTMHFSLSEQLEHEFDTMACGPIHWQEHYCDTDGMSYTHVFQSHGCDSTVVMHFNMGSAEYSITDIKACDYFEYNGVVYDEPGTILIYTDTLENQAGCDSIAAIRVEISNSDAFGLIEGAHSVYAASSLVDGIYRYEIDSTGVEGDISWSVSNPDWRVVEAADNYCLVLVTTPGTASLKASFTVEECGLVERSFEINAVYYDIDEQAPQRVQVYPNPTKGTLHIEAESIESVRLTNMMGQVLGTKEGNNASHLELHLNGLSPSVYLLEIKTASGIAKNRVVLCR